MTDNTSTSKIDVESWRRGYEAALRGKAFACPDNQNSAWRIGYRDGRAKRLKQHVEAKHVDGWPAGGH
jgi:ribosome modulation factor